MSNEPPISPHELLRSERLLAARDANAADRHGRGEHGARAHLRRPRARWDRRQPIENPAHIEALAELKRAARTHRGLDRLHHAAPSSRELFQALATQGRNLGGATSTLLKQLDLVGAAELEAAIAEVIKRGTPHLAAVHHVLERRRYQRGAPPAVGRHLPVDDRARGPIVTPHPLSDYDGIGRNKDNDD